MNLQIYKIQLSNKKNFIIFFYIINKMRPKKIINKKKDFLIKFRFKISQYTIYDDCNIFLK